MTTQAQKRLPRYRRAATKVPCQITDRDLDILALVYMHRLASSDHMQALLPGSDQGILRRLQRLYHAKYLDRIRPQWREQPGSAKMIYAITNRGVRALLNAGLINQASRTDWNSQNKDLHDLSVRHQLLVSYVRSVLTLGCRRNPDVSLRFWYEGRKLQDTIEVALENGYTQVPVAPDAYLGIEDAQGRLHLFLEADRGTMTVKRFALKLKAYAAYYRAGRHTEKHGISHFRVLTVTSSRQRQANLIEAAKAIPEFAPHRLGRMLLFASSDALSLARPESIFENLWTSPANGEPCSLFTEAPKSIQNGEEKPMQTHNETNLESRYGP